MKEKYGFVYIWYDKKHKRYYIGCHWGDEDDGYICSSNWMRDAYKRRTQDFKRRILVIIHDKRELLNEEYKWLSLIKKEELGKKYYNLKNSFIENWAFEKEKKLSVCEKMKKTRGTNEYREKMRKIKLNNHDKASIKMKEVWVDLEKRKNMLEGRKNSEKVKIMYENWSGENNPNYGKFQSDESKKKISIKQKKRYLEMSVEKREELNKVRKENEKCKEAQRKATDYAVYKVKGTKWYNDGNINFRLFPQEANNSVILGKI
jgi:hypothetical protein